MRRNGTFDVFYFVKLEMWAIIARIFLFFLIELDVSFRIAAVPQPACPAAAAFDRARRLPEGGGSAVGSAYGNIRD